MDVVQENMPAALARGDANAIAHVGAADFVGVAAVDMKDVERKLGAPADEPGQDFARIAGEQVHAPRELPFEEIDAFGRIGVRHDVDAVIFEPRARRQREQRAMARVDADFEQALLEPHRAPDVAASRGERAVRRLVGVAVREVGVENVPFQAFAGLLDELGDALEAQAERIGEDLLERVALGSNSREFPLEG